MVLHRGWSLKSFRLTLMNVVGGKPVSSEEYLLRSLYQYFSYSVKKNVFFNGILAIIKGSLDDLKV